MYVFVFFCVGRGLAIGRRFVQGILPNNCEGDFYTYKTESRGSYWRLLSHKKKSGANCATRNIWAYGDARYSCRHK